MKAGGAKRSYSLQAVRALAALCIFLSHCQFPNIVTWAVTVFFVLSGFVMSRAALRREDSGAVSVRAAFSYAAGKLRVLYGLHLLTILPFLATELISLRHWFSVGAALDLLGRLAADVLLVQSWIPAQRYYNAFNGVAWYLSTMGFIYFIFPFLLKGLRRVRERRTLFAALGLVLAAQFAAALAQDGAGALLAALPGFPEAGECIAWFYYIFPPFRALDFIAGCLLGALFAGAEPDLSRGRLWTRDLLCLGFFALGVLVYRGELPLLSVTAFRKGVIFVPFALMFVLSFAHERGAAARLFTNRVSVFLGDISAPFFLIHQCFIHIFYLLPPFQALGFVPRLFAVSALSLVCSVISAWLWTRRGARAK